MEGGHAAMTNLYRYPNTQEAATLWYHDHALGATRLNVYAGMAGFYFLRDDAEDAIQLPGWSGDNQVQEVNRVTGLPQGDPYLPEIEIAIQDRMFDQNGQLYFPAVGDNPMDHPFWVPEFLGDIITVNGKTWPYLSVAPRKYRLRLLNGSNARFYELWLQDLATGVNGPKIYQIGTDGGLLDTPAVIDPALGGKLLIGPGERVDLVIDFGSVANPNPAQPFAVWTLRNQGRSPFPKGTPPVGQTTGRVMQFVVNGQMTGPDNSVIAGRPAPIEKLVNFATATPAVTVDKTRQLTLNEVMAMAGPLEALVNNTKWDGHSTRPYDDFVMDPTGASMTHYSEIIEEGNTELWQIINLTADAHPMHLHLVQFQLVSRQPFDVKKYSAKYDAAYMAAGFPMGVMDAPGWGPPLDYNTGKDPNGVVWTPFLGGNPDVTPFLKGAATPANPNEQGWKDTFIMYPGQVTTVIVRFAPTDAVATGKNYFDFNPDGGHGYVWHCHIVDHEDNEMMRPYLVTPSASAPGGRLDAPVYAGYQMVHPAGPALVAQAASAAPIGAETPDKAETPVTPEATSGLPKSFALGQNSPNPFNPSTEIRFTLPEAGYVQLVVYNSLGQKVATLMDQNVPAGFHSVRLDASDLASGVYFYKITAGKFTDIKKMVLLK
jgi:FtsP/CotA-like multicopper oxidase with cupredoxin domain